MVRGSNEAKLGRLEAGLGTGSSRNAARNQ